jgi:hypothetical protein
VSHVRGVSAAAGSAVVVVDGAIVELATAEVEAAEVGAAEVGASDVESGGNAEPGVEASDELHAAALRHTATAAKQSRGRDMPQGTSLA